MTASTRRRITGPTTAAILAVVAVPAAAATTYTVIDLGDLPGGGHFSHAYGINDSGQVIGTGHVPGDPYPHAFLWDNGVFTDLGDLPGGDHESAAHGINASGQVVGYSEAATANKAFLWSGGVMTDLGGLPGADDWSYATSINSGGQVVGQSGAAGSHRAFLWQDLNGNGVSDSGEMQDLGDLPGGDDWSYATSINATGQVVGDSSVAGASHAFLWDNGAMIDLGALSGGHNSSAAMDINDGSQVVGFSGMSGTGSARAFLWEDLNGNGVSDLGEMQDLGDLPGGSDVSVAWAINEGGQVVGQSVVGGDGRAFVWDSADGMIDLNTRLDASGDGWTLYRAEGINDSGWIIGSGLNPAGTGHGFLLKPVPEPATLALLALGGLALLRWRRWYENIAAQARR